MGILGILGMWGAGIAAWLVLERILRRVLPKFERYLPDDICGPDGWMFDTVNKSGIFDIPPGRLNG